MRFFLIFILPFLSLVVLGQEKVIVADFEIINDDTIFISDISEVKISRADQFGLMFESFCNTIENNMTNPYNFEEDLLNQAKVMEAHRLSNKENRFVNLSEILA